MENRSGAFHFLLGIHIENIKVNLPVACPFLQIKFCWELQSLSLNDPVVLRAPQFSIPATLSGSLAHWLKKTLDLCNVYTEIVDTNMANWNILFLGYQIFYNSGA